MKTFYIANDDFSQVGHPWHTLRSLCERNLEPVILITQRQRDEFKQKMSGLISINECLPNADDGRYVPPHVLGGVIAKALIEGGLEDGDLIVLKMPFPYLMLSCVYACALTQICDVNFHISVLISQTDEGYAYEKIKYSDCFRIIDNLPNQLVSKISLFHEREALKEYWSNIFPNLNMGLCGYVTEWFGRDQISDSADSIAEELKLVYLGEARSEKGFDRVALIVNEWQLKNGFLIHCDANENNKNESYFNSMKLLNDCLKNHKKITIENQRIKNSYNAAFRKNNIALMLYSAEYRCRGSGVIQECVAAGMRIIAYEDLGFHNDYPDHVITVKRDQNTQSLTEEIQKIVVDIESNKYSKPNKLLIECETFRDILASNLKKNQDSFVSNKFVFIVTNNVHQQGCSKIIEAQQYEVVKRGLYPIYVSFEWPNLDYEWSANFAFERMWDMQMNCQNGSYGLGYLTIPLITKSEVLRKYNSFYYSELVEISEDVDTDLLDDYLKWRNNPVVILNYVHHYPILKNKLKNFDTTFLEMHDISTVQQALRMKCEDAEIFYENIRKEVSDLSQFKHKFVLSDGEVKFLKENGCDVDYHSYLDVLLDKASQIAKEFKFDQYRTKSQNYMCVIASGHPSNVEDIKSFIQRECANYKRKIPIYIYGNVCKSLEFDEVKLSNSSIFLKGYAENVYDIISKSLITLNPVNVGTGTPIKVIESIAYGVPCLASARSTVAISHHPLLIEFDFEHNLLDDIEIISIASIARDNFKKSENKCVSSNALGKFLDEYTN